MEKAESPYLANVKQVTTGFAAGEGLLFRPTARRSFTRPKRRRPAILSTRSSRRTWRKRPLPRQPWNWQDDLRVFSPRRQQDQRWPSHLDPGAAAQYEPELKQRADDQAKGVRRRYKWDFDDHMDIFEADPDGTNLKRLTDTPGYDAEGSFSPDGRQIVFCSEVTGSLELHIMNADGSNVRQLTKFRQTATTAARSFPRTASGSSSAVTAARRTNWNFMSSMPTAPANAAWLTRRPGCRGARSGIRMASTSSIPELTTRVVAADRIMTCGGSTSTAARKCGSRKPLGRRSARFPLTAKTTWTSTRDGRQPSQLYIADFTPPRE